MKKNIYNHGVITLILLFTSSNWIYAQSIPMALTSFSTNDSYNAYFNFAVNNTHFIDNDEQGNIYVVFVDSVKQLTVMTRNSGVWYTQVVATALPSKVFKNPNIQWKQGKVHVSWFELSSGNTIIKYAKGTPVTTGTYSWNISNFTNLPINAPKYLCMSIPDSTLSPHIGFTEAGDFNARMFINSGESSISPLTSGNVAWDKSSDISIASDSNIVVIVWEEHWNVSIPESRLLFTISYDGGTSWSTIQKVLNPDPNSQVGDPSIVIADSIVYVAFHGDVAPSVSHIRVARKFPSMSNFELLNFGTIDTGVVGKGWLPNIDALSQNPDKVVVSWERTDGAYFNKSEHKVAVAYICNASQPNPTLILGPETTSPVSDTTLYDLNSNIIISPDGQTVSWVWLNIEEVTSNTDLKLTLFFQEDTLNCLTTGMDEIDFEKKLTLYPNPSFDKIYFSSPQSNIYIYDIRGVLVLENINEATMINIVNFPNGVYIVKTNNGYSKFVKYN